MASLEDFKYLDERIQKTTEALYRVTDLFPEEEPLKWSLRKNATEIFSEIIELKALPIYKKARNLKEVVDNILKLLNFLELASANSFISQLNFEVLIREYSALADFIKSKKEEFLPAELPALPKLEAEITKGQSKGQSKGQEEESKGHEKGHENNRKQQILSIITEKGWINIKDIVLLFQDKGVGRKTIQRELLSLVAQGVLKTEGEKRWRKYALIDPVNWI